MKRQELTTDPHCHYLPPLQQAWWRRPWPQIKPDSSLAYLCRRGLSWCKGLTSSLTWPSMTYLPSCRHGGGVPGPAQAWRLYGGTGQEGHLGA